eukprot:scpid60630/ scgid16508/ Alpha-(1,3)-fucosyltransferase 10; Fucosyltransferase X; Galactoside 3-L-fucosyltransferase 10
MLRWRLGCLYHVYAQFAFFLGVRARRSSRRTATYLLVVIIISIGLLGGVLLSQRKRNRAALHRDVPGLVGNTVAAAENSHYVGEEFHPPRRGLDDSVHVLSAMLDMHPGSEQVQLSDEGSYQSQANELSVFCQHNSYACLSFVQQQQKVRKWKIFQKALRKRWREELTEYELSLKTGELSATAEPNGPMTAGRIRTVGRSSHAAADTSLGVDPDSKNKPMTAPTKCPVYVDWKSDGRIDEVLGGSVMRTIMDSATQQCPVKCQAAENEAAAHISLVMFDKDIRRWARRQALAADALRRRPVAAAAAAPSMSSEPTSTSTALKGHQLLLTIGDHNGCNIAAEAAAVAPRLIARLNLEGHTSGFTKTVFNVPNLSSQKTDGSQAPAAQSTEKNGNYGNYGNCSNNTLVSASSILHGKLEMETDILVSLFPESDVPINYMYFVTDYMHCGVHVGNTPRCILDYIRTKLPRVKKLHEFKYGYHMAKIPNSPDSQSASSQTANLSVKGKAEKGQQQQQQSDPEPIPVLASMFVSTCEELPFDENHRGNEQGNVRKKLLQQLVSRISVHSYGRCLHTAGLKERVQLLKLGQPLLRRQAAKVFLASHYPFLISFENSIEDHYRTEKVFLSLLSGSVPVLLSDPTVDTVLPKNSVINAHDFPDMQSLASYMDRLARDEDLYAKYFEWRNHSDELEKLFLRLYQTSLHSLGQHSIFCRMCQLYHNEYDPVMRRCR